MGYEVQIEDPVDAITVATVPNDETLTVGSINQEVEIGFGVGGRISLAPTGVPVAKGVALTD
jgi:hypothetical protein